MRMPVYSITSTPLCVGVAPQSLSGQSTLLLETLPAPNQPWPRLFLESRCNLRWADKKSLDAITGCFYKSDGAGISCLLYFLAELKSSL